MTSKIKQYLKRSKVIPVLVIENLQDAVPLASALYHGGLEVLEITLRTEAAIESIKQIKQALPDAVIASGTVINAASLEASLEAGVDFVVSPGSTPELLSAVKSNNALILPGATSATEVMNLLALGYNCLKFFPAEAAGGVKMLSSLNGPLPQAQFCPTGGINLSNAKQYLQLDNVVCVGGTWMLTKQLIQQKNWSAITQLAKQASLL
ncbi:MAG: bifunctional 4-hydroxy-2-oxoglutarate aldolase/2-dehydro-3-deoxy-phosphogluconate aldolase [Enterobacterales bacterium]|nr:bifunctional 4-hydroxy-2-oxoglutarate aldolase/2-dehydro-3-deoxy-phosphogluconate aldolase [Enterobacterales bacterium]